MDGCYAYVRSISTGQAATRNWIKDAPPVPRMSRRTGHLNASATLRLPQDRKAHKSEVQALIARIFEKSPEDFYEKSYEGYYCVGCEAFKQDDEIVDSRCILDPTRVLEWVEERNWFFRLSKYRDFLLASPRLPNFCSRRRAAMRF